ncbi:MAG: KilA-N domain-containing protein [Sporocytophaga sp.]|nr:KilA-N domain-containing protein [Sporocytophaga sp.]
MAKSRTLNVNESNIAVIHQNETDYISLTDMTASFKEGSGLVGKWISNKNTLEYLGVWEKINNPHFNYPSSVACPPTGHSIFGLLYKL